MKAISKRYICCILLKPTKSISLLCCICMFLLFSCKKDNKPHTPPDTKLYPMSFNVSGFNQTQVPIDGKGKIKTAALTTQATDTVPVQRIIYQLYTDEKYRKLISSRNSDKGSNNFGVFTDSVPPGNYVVSFGAGSLDLKVKTDYNYYYYTYFFGTPSYWDDTFFKSVPVKVTSSGINLNVSLDRVTAKLDLIIKDAIPAGTTKIAVSFPDLSCFDTILGTSGYPTTNGAVKTITGTDIGKTNYTISMNTFNNVKPFDVIINYYGSNPNGPLGTKTVKNVVCKHNTKTTLSGNLFTSGNSEFTITVNQDWNTSTIQF